MAKIEGAVLDVVTLSDRISSLRVAATDCSALPIWEAGAHVEFDVADGARAYSLIAFDPVTVAPSFYQIAVQREDDGQGGSRAMHDLQIGDPITEKGLIEVIELARDAKLYTAITDCGAGGFSSSVGEMGEDLGVDVDLATVHFPQRIAHDLGALLLTVHEPHFLLVP